MQWLGAIGAAGRLSITEDKFLDILRVIGQPLQIVFRNAGGVPCTCYDSTYGTSDKRCTICDGTGFTTGWTTKADVGFVELRGERIQGAHQRLQTKAGRVHTIDATAFIKAKWYDPNPIMIDNIGIKLEDFIIFQNLEMMVISVIPRYGTVPNRPVFLRIDLEKQPYNITDTANVKIFQ